MSDSSPSSADTSPTSVNLARSSRSWTQAESAAGFILRYLSPMKSLLMEILPVEADTDRALKRLLTHLVSAGFGEKHNGNLRQFVAMAIRSCVRSHFAESKTPVPETVQTQLARVGNDSDEWRDLWRDCLLQRAWRALERLEHQDLSRPLFELLWITEHEGDLPTAELISRVAEKTQMEVAVGRVVPLLAEARMLFAQFLADEVAETLQNPDVTAVKAEIAFLQLDAYYDGVPL